MRELVEFIGKRIGVSSIDIFNQYKKIDHNVGELVKAGYKQNKSLDETIELAISYSLSLKLQMKYPSVLDYAQTL